MQVNIVCFPQAGAQERTGRYDQEIARPHTHTQREMEQVGAKQKEGGVIITASPNFAPFFKYLFYIIPIRFRFVL